MYLGYQNNKIKFYTELPLDKDLYNLDKTEETDQEYVLDGDEYVLKTETWEEEQIQKERKKLDDLNVTRADMFEALIRAKGVRKSDIKTMLENYENLTYTERMLYINRLEEALNFYRGYPAINLIGELLDITSEQLDKYFLTKNWEDLIN